MHTVLSIYRQFSAAQVVGVFSVGLMWYEDTEQDVCIQTRMAIEGMNGSFHSICLLYWADIERMQ